MSQECLHSRGLEPSACKADALLLPYGLFFFVGLDVFGYKKMECLGSACTLGGSDPLLVRQMLSFSLTGCAFGYKKMEVTGLEPVTLCL